MYGIRSEGLMQAKQEGTPMSLYQQESPGWGLALLSCTHPPQGPADGQPPEAVQERHSFLYLLPVYPLKGLQTHGFESDAIFRGLVCCFWIFLTSGRCRRKLGIILWPDRGFLNRNYESNVRTWTCSQNKGRVNHNAEYMQTVYLVIITM